MEDTAKIDSTGRIVLPKPLRNKMHLEPGDTLRIEAEGERITLRPLRPKVNLKKERGIWVYQGDQSTASIPELIDRERGRRIRESLA